MKLYCNFVFHILTLANLWSLCYYYGSFQELGIIRDSPAIYKDTIFIMER